MVGNMFFSSGADSMKTRPLDSQITALANAAAGVRASVRHHGATMPGVSPRTTADDLDAIVVQSDKVLDMVVAATGDAETLERVRLIIAEAIFTARLEADLDPFTISYNGWRVDADSVSRTVFNDGEDGSAPEAPFTVGFMPGSVRVSDVRYTPDIADEPAFSM